MAPDFEKLDILVVADPLPLKMLIMPVLDEIGVRNIVSAVNIREGFNLFRRHTPTLAIVDWDMTQSSGVDLIKMIRRDATSPNQKAPVIVLANHETATNRVTPARDLGANGFLIKPFTATDLRTQIASALDDSREFIVSQQFVGPNRRERVAHGYDGPFRRESDSNDDREAHL
jgi:DNA-binding response OmpR family regulator